ncbi:MAG TPA: putative metal-dependent hydrolase [Gemmatimonadaceae bacterium]|nr:putative metal-dependent hydrolase [Gemmatimonadaceae bacterium]
MDLLSYPIGRSHRPESLTVAQRRSAIDAIADAPTQLRAAIRGLDDTQLDTPYRPGGWTVRQVVHHVPDSHMNAFVRFKLALTEDTPTIKPYDEAAWATLEDARTTPIETSLTLLDTLHDRWIRILNAMSPADFERKLNHPENGTMSLDQMLALYEWHGKHHVAHITSLRARNGWA